MEKGDEAQEWQGGKGWGKGTERSDIRKESQSFYLPVQRQVIS